MIKTTTIAAVALIATLAQANAGPRYPYQPYGYRYQPYVGGVTSAPVQLPSEYDAPYYGPHYGSYYAPRVSPGPIWAGPNQCFTDDGYGRYASCDARGGR
jgi:hypothetical protein